jgi:putative salt-induced outer membrane protein
MAAYCPALPLRASPVAQHAAAGCDQTATMVDRAARKRHSAATQERGDFAMKRLAIFGLGLLAAPALADPIPPAVEAMIDAAGPADLATIAGIAKKTNPASAAEIDAKVAAINAAAAKAREEKLAAQGFFEGWSGQGEAGGFISTGNTENRGVAIGVTLNKESRQWKHSLRGIVDYQEDNGVASRERYFAGYEGNWKFSSRAYALLALSWERDKFTGFTSRFTEALGIGYRVIDTPSLTLAVDAGPALRQTRFVTGVTDNTFAARGGLNLKWQISEMLNFTQAATYYYDNSNNSLLALSQLTARLNGRLSARFSFQYNNESNPPPGRQNSDTVTRATLVYSF